MSLAMAIGDDRGYLHFAGIHGLPLPAYCTHGSPLFLPWHRAYLYFFERALADRVPGVTLPWWDWTSASSHVNGIPRMYAESKAGAAANPLVGSPLPADVAKQTGFMRTTRKPKDPGGLPTFAQVSELLEMGDFLDFSGAVEDIHNAVHVWVGGTMGEIPVAAYDPVFWAHHTMIDRLWRLWQLKHVHSGPPASLLRAALPPFGMTVEQTLDSNTLGYDYAAFSAAVPGTRRT
jgi:tyrosinase